MTKGKKEIGEGIIFSLTSKQLKTFNKWREKKQKENINKKPLIYSFSFTQTGIGIVELVICSDGTELDLTDYTSW